MIKKKKKEMSNNEREQKDTTGSGKPENLGEETSTGQSLHSPKQRELENTGPSDIEPLSAGAPVSTVEIAAGDGEKKRKRGNSDEDSGLPGGLC